MDRVLDIAWKAGLRVAVVVGIALLFSSCGPKQGTSSPKQLTLGQESDQQPADGLWLCRQPYSFSQDVTHTTSSTATKFVIALSDGGRAMAQQEILKQCGALPAVEADACGGAESLSHLECVRESQIGRYDVKAVDQDGKPLQELVSCTMNFNPSHNDRLLPQFLFQLKSSKPETRTEAVSDLINQCLGKDTFQREGCITAIFHNDVHCGFLAAPPGTTSVSATDPATVPTQSNSNSETVTE